MAITPTTRTDLTKTLKEVYASNRMYATFNRRRVVLNLLERRPQSVAEGLQYRYNVHTSGTPGGAYISENEPLPDTAAQANDWLIFSMATYAHRIGLSGQLIHSTRGNRAAMARALNYQAQEAVKDARDFFARSIFMTARGTLTKCQSIISNSPTAIIQVESVRRLVIGMAVAIRANSDDTDGTNGTTSGSPGYIADIDPDTKQVTLKTAAGANFTLNGTTWADPDAYGNSDHSMFLESVVETTKAPWGLEDIVSNVNPPGSALATASVYYGQVNRSAAGNDWSKARHLDLKGETITHDRGDEACTLVEALGNGEVQCFITTHEILRDVKRLEEGSKRAPMQEKVGNGWFPYALLAGKKVYADRYCTPRTIYGLDTSQLWFAENKELDWEDTDGAILSRLEEKWGYQALLTRMFQLNGIPNSHVRIDNVGSNSSVM